MHYPDRMLVFASPISKQSSYHSRLLDDSLDVPTPLCILDGSTNSLLKLRVYQKFSPRDRFGCIAALRNPSQESEQDV